MTTLLPYDRLLLIRHLKTAARSYDGLVATLREDLRSTEPEARLTIARYQALAEEARAFVKRMEDDRS